MRRAAVALLGPVRLAFDGESVAGLGEGELLARFVARGDGLAFAALMARHGPMVLGVCRRLLADPEDVEDAFQATFLVLVRRAGSIGDRDRLAPWLFGVARKVANRSRQSSDRRRSRESPVDVNLTPAPERDDRRDLARALVEEIDRLPGELRGVVVSCCVEGLSYDEAADRLRCTAPAVRGRLARARQKLRDRLGRRGFAPSAPVPGAWPLLGPIAAKPSVPLIESTARAALAFAAGRVAAPGMVPASVAVLADGVIRAMSLTPWKTAAVALLALGIAGSGAGVFAQRPDGSELPPVPSTPPRVESVSAPTPAPAPVAAPPSPPAPPSPGVPPGSAGPGDGDRLAGLEQKLDRLIRALEAPARTTTRAPFAQIEAPRPTEPPRPPATPGLSDLPPGPVQPGRSMMGINSPDRIGILEQKLGRLEARIVALERKVAANDRDDVDPTSAPPAARRSRKPTVEVEVRDEEIIVPVPVGQLQAVPSPR